MPNIVLSSGEKRYKPLTETVAEILNELTNSTTSAEALVFNGKKLAPTANLSDIPHLADKHNIYVIEKPSKTIISPLDVQISTTDMRKYRRRFEALSDEEQNWVRGYFSNPENISAVLNENPCLQNDQVAVDILSDFTLFANFAQKHEHFFVERPYFLAMLKKALSAVVAERANSENSFGQSSSRQQPQFADFSNRQQPSSSSSTTTAPITSQMLQQALDMIGFSNPSNSASTPSLSSNSSSTQFQQQQNLPSATLSSTNSQQDMAMEVEPNYAELRQTYAAQLEQMREFGFADDEESIRALQACDGILESALELVITIRESGQP